MGEDYWLAEARGCAALLQQSDIHVGEQPPFQVQCTLTKQEMPLRADTINGYLSGKKYARNLNHGGTECLAHCVKDDSVAFV